MFEGNADDAADDEDCCLVVVFLFSLFNLLYISHSLELKNPNPFFFSASCSELSDEVGLDMWRGDGARLTTR